MNRIMITATNTMGQLQKQLDVISNNIANSQTTGYKKKQATFGDLLIQQFQTPIEREENIRRTPPGIRTGVGAKISQIQTDFTLGSIVKTDRNLDFALTKENQLFKILVDNNNEMNIHYTRDGAFYLSPINNNDMALVTSEGYQVLDENDDSIIVTGDIAKINLQTDGALSFEGTDGSTQQFALGIVQVQRPQFLEQLGDNLYALPRNLQELGVTEEDIFNNLQGNNRDEIGLQQNSLEMSNVDIGEEMTNLLQTQRSFQFQAKAISLADQMQGLINGIR